MKKDINSVDDFFKKSLQDHKVPPSEAARNRFLDEAVPAGSAGYKNFRRWYYMLVAAVVITAAVFLYFHFSHDNTPLAEEINTNPVSETINTPESKTDSSALANPVNSSNADKMPAARFEPTNESISGKTELNTVAKRQTRTVNKFPHSAFGQRLRNEPIAYQPDLEGKKLIKESVPTEPDVNVEIPAQPLLAPELTMDLKTESNDTVNNAANSSDVPKPADISQPVPTPLPVQIPFGFTTSLHYSLDWNPKSEGCKLVHIIGIEGKIQKQRFSISTSIGFASTNGYSKYEVQYNDYLGNYQKLDSITFAYDQKRYNLVPTYYMSDTKVWDSVLKLDSYQEEMRYIQLRIPVMAGYDIIQRGRFVVGLKTGVEMLFYLKSNTVAEYEYNSGQNKLIGINQLPDDYARNNFWFLANISAAYNIGKRMVFEIEPHVKYLLNPDKTSASSTQENVVPALRSTIKFKF